MATTKSPMYRFLFVLLAAAAVVSAVAFRLGGTDATTASNSRGTWLQSQASQLVFFAVLEGLYRDGVSNADVDLIIPPGENGKPTFAEEHFVYACPLCHPAFEAFRLYRQRDDFFGTKAPLNTLGPGLDSAIATRLRSRNTDERRKAIEELIGRWVSQRLEMMRLTDAEREAITREMEQGRKKGMGGLKNAVRAGQMSQSRTNCPICDGSFGACGVK